MCEILQNYPVTCKSVNVHNTGIFRSKCKASCFGLTMNVSDVCVYLEIELFNDDKSSINCSQLGSVVADSTGTSCHIHYGATKLLPWVHLLTFCFQQNQQRNSETNGKSTTEERRQYPKMPT